MIKKLKLNFVSIAQNKTFKAYKIFSHKKGNYQFQVRQIKPISSNSFSSDRLVYPQLNSKHTILYVWEFSFLDEHHSLSFGSPWMGKKSDWEEWISEKIINKKKYLQKVSSSDFLWKKSGFKNWFFLNWQLIVGYFLTAAISIFLIYFFLFSLK